VLGGALLAGCSAGAGTGGRVVEAGSSGALIWEAGPVAVPPSKIDPDDRVVGGTLRNDSFRNLDLAAARLRLLDAGGREVDGAMATFASAPGHGLWPSGRINRMPEFDQYRVGLKVRLRPGEQTKLTVAWTQRPGVAPPAAVDYGAGSLPLDVR
jgi:hypothetical protein